MLNLRKVLASFYEVCLHRRSSFVAKCLSESRLRGGFMKSPAWSSWRPHSSRNTHQNTACSCLPVGRPPDYNKGSTAPSNDIIYSLFIQKFCPGFTVLFVVGRRWPVMIRADGNPSTSPSYPVFPWTTLQNRMSRSKHVSLNENIYSTLRIEDINVYIQSHIDPEFLILFISPLWSGIFECKNGLHNKNRLTTRHLLCEIR